MHWKSTEWRTGSDGVVIWGTDPLSDTGRPMLVVGAPRFPSHGVQLITALVSNKTYHDDAITLRDREILKNLLYTRLRLPAPSQ